LKAVAVDDDNEMGEVADEFVVPSYPFVESAAIADAMDMGANIAEAAAAFMRGYAMRLAAGHNYQVEQEDAMMEAAAEIESMIRPTFSDGDGA
jgi:hypothetical protein